MENVRTIFMHGDTINVLTIHISSKMGTFVYNETTLPMHLGLLCEYRIEQPCAN